MKGFWALAFGGLLWLAPPARADVLRVGQVSAVRTATEIVVPVSLENTDEVGGFQVTITYDPSRLTPLAPMRGARAGAFEFFSSNIDQPGLVVVVAIADFVGGGSPGPVPPGLGEIFVLRFAAALGVEAGTVPLRLVGDPASTSTSNPSGTTSGFPSLVDGWIQLNADIATHPATWGGVKRAFAADARAARQPGAPAPHGAPL